MSKPYTIEQYRELLPILLVMARKNKPDAIYPIECVNETGTSIVCNICGTVDPKGTLIEHSIGHLKERGLLPFI